MFLYEAYIIIKEVWRRYTLSLTDSPSYSHTHSKSKAWNRGFLWPSIFILQVMVKRYWHNPIINGFRTKYPMCIIPWVSSMIPKRWRLIQFVRDTFIYYVLPLSTFSVIVIIYIFLISLSDNEMSIVIWLRYKLHICKLCFEPYSIEHTI